MKTSLLFIILISIGLVYHAQAQNIQDVRAETENNKVVVHYNLTGGKFYHHYTIRLYASIDGGDSFQGPLKEVSGDVGANIRKGQHSIRWDAMKEMPVVDKGYVFDVRAEVFEDDMKKLFFISYTGNLVTPFGLRVGMINKLGWYAEFRASLNAFNTASYQVKDEEFQDYDKPGYYEFNGNEGFSAYSAVAGVTYQLSRNFYLFGGLGYGKEEYHWQIDEYSYDPEEKIGESWVKDDETSLEGFELDLGGMMRFNKILISAGITTINVEVFNWTAGIGIAF
ncbi:MAG: hypothetical protein RQ761_12930 [Bacteroidales bacterium]|nr:hypothetical protein [Bacteroidales bacterium]